MAQDVLPPPPINEKPGSFTWLEWYRKLRNYVTTSGSVPWYIINFAGSNITDIALRSHQNLQNVQGGSAGEFYHLTQAQQSGIIGGTDTSLHYHSADRDRANHTGTQAHTTITGLGPLATQSAGFTGTVTLAKLTTGGTNGSMTLSNGVVTAYTAPT